MDGGVIVLIMYILGGLLVLVLGAIFFARSLASRKYYCCPQCGERFRVELMKASRCNVCGAPIPRDMLGDN